jgi:hypothetical protein
LSDDVGSRERCVGLLFLYGFWVFLGAESLQNGNKIGDAGACSIGEGLKCNSSVQTLILVSCGVRVCVER